MNYTFSKKLSLLLTTSALLLSATACSSEQRPRTYNQAPGIMSGYVDQKLADQGDLTTFYQALYTTGVINELRDNTEYTIFAPTNAAFAQLQPRVYPCFYSVQCRQQVAAVLRNHIVPRNESVDRLSKWGGDIPTIGTRRVDVEEPYKGHYTFEGYRVLYQNENNESSHVRGHKVSLYRIDGVLVSDQDLATFRTVPTAAIPSAVIEKTVTTYRTPVSTIYAPQSLVPNTYLVPGGYTPTPVVMTNEYSDAPEDLTETTTVTHSTTTTK